MREVAMRGVISLLALVALISSGCALTSKADPLEPMYITADAGLVSSDERSPLAEEGAQLLRLRAVIAAPHLSERVVQSDEDYVVRFSDVLRWTEPPSGYVQRALSRSLFQKENLTRSDSTQTPTLKVELTSFDHLTLANQVRVQARVVLLQDKISLWEDLVTVVHPISGTADPKSIASTFAAAVTTIANRIAGPTIKALKVRKK